MKEPSVQGHIGILDFSNWSLRRSTGWHYRPLWQISCVFRARESMASWMAISLTPPVGVCGDRGMVKWCLLMECGVMKKAWVISWMSIHLCIINAAPFLYSWSFTGGCQANTEPVVQSNACSPDRLLLSLCVCICKFWKYLFMQISVKNVAKLRSPDKKSFLCKTIYDNDLKMKHAI